MVSRKILPGVVVGMLLAAAASLAADPLAYRSIGPADRAAKLISLLSSEDSGQRRQGAAKLSDDIAMLTSVLGENPDGVLFLTTVGESMIPLLADEHATIKARVERLLEQLVDGLAATAERGNPIAKERALDVLAALSERMSAVEGNEAVAAASDRASRILKAAHRTARPLDKSTLAAQTPRPVAPVEPASAIPTPPPPPVAAAPEPKPAAPAVAAAPVPKPAPAVSPAVPPPAPPTPVAVVIAPKAAPVPARPARTSGSPSAQDLIVLRMLDEKLRAAGERERLAALELAEKVSETVRNGSLSTDAYMSRLSQNITDSIRGFLTSPSASLRQMAARTAGLLQDVKSVDPLIDLLGDADAAIRKEAALSLRAITGKDFGLDVDQWKNWSVGNG
jgi:outer membrane biosynthesis protein TonB